MHPINQMVARACGLLTCLCALLFAALSPAHAAVTATFSNGTADYPSTATSGWNEPWQLLNGDAWLNQPSWAEIRTTSPLNNGGAYLSVGHQSETGGPYLGGITLSRQFNGDATVDLHIPYKVSLDFRARYSGFNEAYGNNSWALRTGGNNQSWKFEYASGASSAWIDTGIPYVNDGRVYHVEVSLNPTTQTFVATLTQGTSSFTTPTLASPGTYNTNRNAIAFHAEGTNSFGQFFSFDVDNISVTQLPHTPVASPAEYFVTSSGGNDANPGTSQQPWATLAKAFASVPVNQGKIIRVGAGTFNLGGTVAIPPGVSLIGAGQGVTTLVGALTITNRDEITLADFSLSGNNLAYPLGLFIRDALKITLRDLSFDAYLDTALSVQRVDRSTFARLTITNSSWSNRIPNQGGTQTQAMNIGRLTDCSFTRLSINTLNGRGGEALGTGDDTWIPELEDYAEAPTFLRNVSITHSTFVVDEFYAWGNGWSPQCCIELWHCELVNVDISYNKFNNNTSIATKSAYTSNVRIHHNEYTNAGYACEVDINNLEFDHNVIDGGTYAIAFFGNQTRYNLNVHHNVFKNLKNNVQLVNFGSGVHENFKFVNNTVIITDGAPLFNIPNKPASQTISNNVFISTVSTVPFLVAGNTLSGVNNNYYEGMPTVGTSPITGPSLLTLSGAQPDPYYRPLAGSALIDKGLVFAGITDGYLGAKPDLGAFERGNGITREYWTGLTGTTVASLTGNAAYPLSPTGTGTLPGLRSTNWTNAAITSDWADNYGERLRGFIVAPATGAYTFWISANDAAELWLSTDDNPGNRVRIASVASQTLPLTWDTETGQRSSANTFTFAGGAPGVITLTAGRRYYVEVLHKEGTGSDHLAIGWRKPTNPAGDTPSELVPDKVLTPWLAATGALTREYWTSLNGTTLTSLTTSPRFPFSPTGRDTISSGRATSWSNPTITKNWANSYGQFVRGFITAPSTGAYTFWISGDETCELWLSPDDQPNSAVRIAQLGSYTTQDQWTTFASQRSTANAFTFGGGAPGVINLTAGRRYYLKVLHKEGSSNDHLSVGWRKPTDPTGTVPSEILPAAVLAPYGH